LAELSRIGLKPGLIRESYEKLKAKHPEAERPAIV
jgi:hypothetical protein